MGNKKVENVDNINRWWGSFGNSNKTFKDKAFGISCEVSGGKKRISRRIVATLMAFILIGTGFVQASPLAGQETEIEIKGHWAEKEILRAIELGLVGDNEGKFPGDQPITRGEMALVLDNLLKYKTASTNYFNDLEPSSYTDSALRLVAAGILTGEGQLFHGDSTITIEETLVILGNVFQLKKLPQGEYKPGELPQVQTKQKKPSFFKLLWDKIFNRNKAFKFKDEKLISPEFLPMISLMVENNLISKEKFKELRPKNSITWAEFLFVLDYLAPEVFENPKSVSDKKFDSLVLITSDNMIFSNCNFSKNIYLGPSVNPETVVFQDCTGNNTVIIPDGTNLNQNADFDYELASFTTHFDPNKIERSINIKVAMAALDNRVIAPGERFSYNQQTGKKTYEKGYKDAIIVSGNKLIGGIGGGVCQTATTLFNAAMLSGLKIDERHQHSLEFSYVEPGRDATVYFGAKDMRFTNTSTVPLMIKASYDESGSITAGIYSQGYYKVPDIKIETTFDGKTYYTKRYSDGVTDYQYTTTYKGKA